MTELVIRLVFSLAVVVGLLLLLGRFAGKRFQAKTGAVIQVVHRQPLSRSSGVAVVTVGDRVLVLGTTEQQVTLLTELDELPTTEQVAEPADASVSAAASGAEPVGTFEQSLEDSLRAHHDDDRVLGHDVVADLVRVATAEEPRVRAVPSIEPSRRAPQPTKDGPLAGSVLSAETWRQALKVARGAARRAS